MIGNLEAVTPEVGSLATDRSVASAIHRRLLPLYAAVALQGSMLWVPVEKLFMNEIGFTAATVGVMAAAYACVTPVLEVPSGILADRWSRRGVLVLSAIALMGATLVGGLSASVPMYIVSAMILGGYFAMYSGTVESIVYDLIVEETGSGDSYQRYLGRVRMTESVALVVSSLAGGWLADLAGPRLTYFVTLPFTALALVCYLRFREPTLHQIGQREPLRNHVTLVVRTLTGRRLVLPIVVLGALTALLAQTIFEFGPLWLVALAAPAVLFGPYWAGLVSTLGLGGLIADRIRLDNPSVARVFVGLLVTSGLLLAIGSALPVVIAAQVMLALLLSIAGIHVSALLQNAVPSTIRAGVSSGASTLSWVAFLPFAIALGWVSTAFGNHAAGWMIAVVTMIAGALLLQQSRRSRRTIPGGHVPDPVQTGA